jgi:Flp pilus assembly protein TadD
VRSNFAGALVAAGHLDEGVEQCQADADVHNALAIALARKGDLPHAVSHLESAVAITPGSVNHQFNLARVLAASRRFKDAIPHLQAASELTKMIEYFHSKSAD